MHGNVLSVFGGPEESHLAWIILTDNGYQPEQLENTFFYQTAGEDASFRMIVLLRQAGLHFTQVFINNCFGSFLRAGGLSPEQTQRIKDLLQMSL